MGKERVWGHGHTKFVLEECGSGSCPTSLIPEFLLQWMQIGSPMILLFLSFCSFCWQTTGLWKSCWEVIRPLVAVETYFEIFQPEYNLLWVSLFSIAMLAKSRCERLADTQEFRQILERAILAKPNFGKGGWQYRNFYMRLRRAIPGTMLIDHYKICAAEQIWYGHVPRPFLSPCPQ